MPQRKVQLAERKVESAEPQQLVHVVRGLATDLKRLGDAHDKHDDALVSAFNGGISASNNDRVKIKSAYIDMPQDAPWVAMALAGSWANDVSEQQAQYLMMPGGEMRTRGSVKSGGAALVWVMPTGCAPPVDARLPLCGAGPNPLFLAAIGEMRIPGAAWTGSFSVAARWQAAPSWSTLFLDKTMRPFAFPAPWPIIIQHGWPKCLGLSIEGCIEETGGEAKGLAGVPIADWEDIGQGQLRLNAVWGLQWQRRYKLRLRLSREEEE